MTPKDGCEDVKLLIMISSGPRNDKLRHIWREKVKVSTKKYKLKFPHLFSTTKPWSYLNPSDSGQNSGKINTQISQNKKSK